MIDIVRAKKAFKEYVKKYNPDDSESHPAPPLEPAYRKAFAKARLETPPGWIFPSREAPPEKRPAVLLFLSASGQAFEPWARRFL